ncbi:putative T6SS immunity periplasmic lipoprotein [Cronobacter turicensis]|uniref:putative T6SS immunity periplasmic lipoprotein n=2 Tax=Cronobacter turicensis TaxID=413502 RepID=UPI000CFD368C|nr:putative T6SS immunity periplasmic lipoprotein [Cronobacter turicensis]
MKVYLSGYSLVLLAGCAGPGDRLPDIQTGQVEINGNTPCITYAVKPGDRLSFVEIANHGGEGDSFRKSVSEEAVYPQQGQCLPTLGYHFESGDKYAAYYSLDNPRDERERIIEVNFSMP